VFERGLDYSCMDIDMARLRVAAARGASAVQGDVTLMPVTAGAIDIVVLRCISHHLTDAAFARMIAESRRVIKPGGRLLFLDAVWDPNWLPGRLLWRIDQGSHPRTEKDMRATLETHFELELHLNFSWYHRYLLALARPRAETLRSGGRPEAWLSRYSAKNP
jgi:SAM-dependent methyltransferase